MGFGSSDLFRTALMAGRSRCEALSQRTELHVVKLCYHDKQLILEFMLIFI